MAELLSNLTAEIGSFKHNLSQVILPSEDKQQLDDYFLAILDEIKFQSDEFTRHQNINTFWLSLAPIQHWFGDCLDILKYADGPELVVIQLMTQLDTWLDNIEKSIPNFMPEHLQIFTILKLAEDGKYYDEQTQEFYDTMPENWPYRHLFEG